MDILKNQVNDPSPSTTELIYDRYGGMLYGYILQFIPDRAKAGDLLAEIFARLAPRLSYPINSDHSVYCWLQVESRKIVLEHMGGRAGGEQMEGHCARTSYFPLLAEASAEHQWVFRESFLYGCKKEELAVRASKDVTYISRILRECLLMIRKNLG